MTPLGAAGSGGQPVPAGADEEGTVVRRLEWDVIGTASPHPAGTTAAPGALSALSSLLDASGPHAGMASAAAEALADISLDGTNDDGFVSLPLTGASGADGRDSQFAAGSDGNGGGGGGRPEALVDDMLAFLDSAAPSASAAAAEDEQPLIQFD